MPMMLPTPPRNAIRLRPAAIIASKASSIVCDRSGRTESNRRGAGFVSMHTPCGSTICRARRSASENTVAPTVMNPSNSVARSVNSCMDRMNVSWSNSNDSARSARTFRRSAKYASCNSSPDGGASNTAIAGRNTLRYPISSHTRNTRRRVSSLMENDGSFNKRDTVLCDTPARSATSLSVAMTSSPQTLVKGFTTA